MKTEQYIQTQGDDLSQMQAVTTTKLKDVCVCVCVCVCGEGGLWGKQK